jgi:hypothetical protein
MRAMLVMPMTVNTRQITMMKYGLRMEKRDIYIHRIKLLCFGLLLVALVILHDRHHLGVNLIPRFQSAPVA